MSLDPNGLRLVFPCRSLICHALLTFGICGTCRTGLGAKLAELESRLNPQEPEYEDDMYDYY